MHSIQSALPGSKPNKYSKVTTGAAPLFERPEVIALASSIGWIFAWATNFEFASIAAAFFGAFFGCRWFWRLISRPSNIVHLLVLGSVALTTILNLGFFVAWAANTIGLDRDFSETFSQIGLTFAQYALAVFYAMIFAAAMALFGKLPQLRESENRLAARLLEIKNTSQGVLIFAVLLCLGIDILAFASGILRFRAIETVGSAEGKVAWFLPFMQAVFAAQIVLNSLLITRSLQGRVKLISLVVAGVSTLLVTFVYFNQGRTSFVLAVFLHFFIGVSFEVGGRQ